MSNQPNKYLNRTVINENNTDLTFFTYFERLSQLNSLEFHCDSYFQKSCSIIIIINECLLLANCKSNNSVQFCKMTNIHLI